MPTPTRTQIFDLHQDASAVRGEELLEDFPRRSLPVIATKLLDWELPSPLGIPSCPLTTSPGRLEFYSRAGFDLLTYKTWRSRPWPPHPSPRWAFAVGVQQPVNPSVMLPTVTASLDEPPGDSRRHSMVNSVGVPSTDPTMWQGLLAEAHRRLGTNQRLIASVMGSPEVTATSGELADDYARAAAYAQEAGVDAIELNLSCPNTTGALVCRLPDVAAEVCEATAKTVSGKGTPLLIKTSYLEPGLLEMVVGACFPHIQGIVAINTVSVPVMGKDQQPFFPGRPTAGLSGWSIREAGLDMARRLAAFNTANQLGLAIIGVGGVMTADDIDAYLSLGVDAVQSCTGAYLDPDLALKWRERATTR